MKKYSNENIRKLNKVSSASYSVVIPKTMINRLGWRERRKLKLKLRGQKITISDAK